MAGYKVSYKILRQQGEDIKAVAKLVDGYAERIGQISGKLGEGELLLEVRNNLTKLREQFVESRTILNTAGEFLTKTVDSYNGVEIRQVKKVDSTRAHNRDFYKNPVVVASAGASAGAGMAAGAGMPAPSATAVNYTDNSVNINYTTVQATPAAAPTPVAIPEPAAAAVSGASDAAAPSLGIGGAAGIAASVGAAGGAIGAGAVLGIKHLIDSDKKAKPESPEEVLHEVDKSDYDPEIELAAALQRVRDLEEE
jgi:hypothetical protein